MTINRYPDANNRTPMLHRGRRQGTSLIEVLTAIFIMALGLVALLTLFPLGAVQMARAVQDERAAQLAANAASTMRNYWKSMCEQAVPQADGNKMMYQAEMSMQSATSPATALLYWFPMAMDDPNSGITNSGLGVQFSNAPWPPANSMTAAVQNNNSMIRSNVPSFPVYVDPVGWRAGGGASNRSALWLGVNLPAGVTSPPSATTVPYPASLYAIPRRTFCSEDWSTSMGRRSWNAMSASQVMRNCLLSDDMNFTGDGKALVQERTGEYSCAWLLRRENNSDRADVTMTVVVYYRRSTESISDEPTYVATPSVSGTLAVPVFSNVVTLHYASSDQKPTVRAGGWILDETLDPTRPQGFYYRVTSIGDEYTPPSAQQPPGLTKAVDLQLETTLKVGPIGPGKRKFVVPDRVLEVFEKGPIEMGSAARVN